MKLEGIHFLLTYLCNYECDHCFLYCSPRSEGTFTISQIKEVLKEIEKIKPINSVCFEGGEPFLMYPLLLEAIKLSSKQGLKTAIETNSYWATSEEDAELWLRPLQEGGLGILETSDDQYHFGDSSVNPASHAQKAATKLGMEISSICIDEPTDSTLEKIEKGDPVYQGNPKIRGRAADKLIHSMPIQSQTTFTECPYENLENPGRVHLDAFGNVHLCQGLSMGNIWKTPLSQLVNEFEPDSHPICGPLLKGGPLELARTYSIQIEDNCVTACHFCTKVCLELLDRFPQYLTPKQVYGIE
jgi:hypothetical protein